jgi:HemY protein
MRRGQDQAALQTLDQLDASGDLNSRGLELMARLCQKLGRGEQLRALGPRLSAAKELPQAQVSELLAQVQLEEVRAAGERKDPTALAAAWSDVPRATRRLPPAATIYVRALLAAGEHVAAERFLRELIEDAAEPDGALIRLYGDLGLPDALLPLERAERWLRRAPENPDLLATCAKLALRAELFGKARLYLEATLARRPGPESSLLYADLLEQTGEGGRALQVLRDSVARSAGRKSIVPRVRLRRR